MKPVYLTSVNRCIISHAAYSNEITFQHFNESFWREKKAIIATLQGRGTTWVINWHHECYVLRHYYRGGYIANILRDRYFYLNLTRSQPWQEWHLLQQLWSAGLPVPEPIAAHVQWSNFFYTADLITKKIPHSRSLTHFLKTQALTTEIATKIAKTIKELHDYGIYHGDLNASNILIDDKMKIWLIDFTNSRQKKMNDSQRQANLARLKKSLNKLLRKDANYYYQQYDWKLIEDGYHSIT